MSFRYKVWTLDVWGNEEDGFEVYDRREIGKISVANTKNRTLYRALVNGHFLSEEADWRHSTYSLVEFDGDDEMIFVDQTNGRPLYQLELDEEGPREYNDPRDPMFNRYSGEPKASSRAMSKPNPLSSLSTAQTVGLAAAGALVLGVVGYAIWRWQAQAAGTVAQLPVVQTPVPGTTPAPGTPYYGVVTGGQVYDPNLMGGQIYSTAAAPSATGPANQTIQYATGQYATYDASGNLVGNSTSPPGG